MNKEEEIVRKTVFVPASLWHRIRVDAVTEGIEISEIVIAALKQYYGQKNGAPDGAGHGRPGAESMTPV